MISVIIPTLDSGRLLVPTLSALVAGSAEGLVREVLLADGGSRDGTARIADAAGCEFLQGPADPGSRLHTAAEAARGPWLLFLEPAAVLEAGWIQEVGQFVARAERSGSADSIAATFRLAFDDFGWMPRIREAAAATRLALLGRPRSEQGLLLPKRYYGSLGGHSPGAHAQAQLLARLRRRVVVLRTRVVLQQSPHSDG